MAAAIYWTLLLVCLGTAELKTVVKDKVVKNNIQNIWDDTPTVITKRGYPAETHMVITDDGYILNMHRIPYGKDGNRGNRGEPRVPVLLQHGLMSSSEDWVISPPGQALAFILSDEGYDVWMGNYRGNYYSKKHSHLNAGEHEEYWHFSWDEMGKFDLPAMYDKILATTGAEKIFHIGHSMGTTGFWVAMNERPEYNDKIRGMFALAPVASVDNMKSPVGLIAPFADNIEWMLDHMGMDEFLPTTKMLNWLGSVVCDEHRDWIEPVCESVLFLLGGFDPLKFNDTMLATIVGSPGRGTSARTVVHYAQSVNNKLFCKYDFGTEGNRAHYDQDTPPLYDLSKVTAPVSLVWAQDDWLADPADTMEIVSGLPNLIPGGVHRVEFDLWSHLDFLWGIDAKPLTYDFVVDMMKKL